MARRIKVEVEIEVEGEYCGRSCIARNMEWRAFCNLFKVFLTRETGLSRENRCQQCLDAHGEK